MPAKIARFTEPAISREALAAKAAGAGIRVRQDDPVLDAAIITDLLLRETASKLEQKIIEIHAQLAGSADAAKAECDAAITQARTLASRAITEAPPYLIDQFKKAIGEVTGDALREIREERKRAESAARFTRRIALAIGIVVVIIASLGIGRMIAVLFAH